MASIDAGEILARTLVEAGVRDVFALHGGHLDSFLQACKRHDIRLIDTRHESTAGHAAEAYARTTGRIGVCAVTAGPGFTNSYTSIANAYLDAIPVLYITSSPPLRENELNVLQGGFDQAAAARPVTKWAHRVTHPERIPDLVALAMRTAYGGRPGPVLLDIPIDVFFTPVDERLVTRATGFEVARAAPAPGPLQRALALLREAERPAIIVGGGTLFPHCDAEILKFSDRTMIPVFTTGKAHGMLPVDHPANCRGAGGLGMLQAMGTPPDVVMLLGARQGLYTAGRSGRIIPHAAKLIQVDTEPAEIGRLREADAGIAAGCQETVRAMLGDAAPWPDRAEWCGRAKAASVPFEQPFASIPAHAPSGRLHPFHAAKAIFDAFGPDVIVTIDGGETGVWAGAFSRSSAPGGVLTNGYLGTLGVGFGFAVGASVAHPERRVVQVVGDGAVGFHLQEIDTMVRHKLPIVSIVFNNTVWGMSIHGQEAIFGSGAGVIAQLNDSNYEQVAIALGGYGERVSNFEEVGPAIQRAFDSGLPAIVNIEIAPDVVHPIMGMMVGPAATPGEVVIPYYENIPAAP